jgi:hypothetical protein
VCRSVTDAVMKHSVAEVTPELVIRTCLEVYDFAPKRMPVL